MVHALLLSPDDQAVSAITGVLEELSVSCERPLDGAAAAKKLNSQSFDLVLVDCENLPAAKLIFDVCRRPKAGGNPVPIAIVDGRAGLPTAFRLGAELILTKPVAKDQARTTIRTAVNRVKKDESVRPSHLFEELHAVAPLSAEPTAPLAQAAAASAATTPVEAIPSISSPPKAPEPSPVSSAHAAVEDLPHTPVSPKIVPPIARDLTPPQSFAPLPKPVAPPPPPVPKPADDPILADLERDEPTPVFTSYQEPSRKKGGRASLLLLLAAMLGGGFYAAWRYQPGFREVVQPWLERVIAAVHTPGPSGSSAPTEAPAAPPLSNSGAQNPTSASSAPATTTASTSAAVAEGSGATSDSVNSNLSATTDATASASEETRAPSTAGDDIPAASNPPPSPKKVIAAVPSDDELPGEKSAVILSSQGAERRLVNRVSPVYPADARKAKLEGTVVLKALVSESGKVAGVRLVEGNPTLATAAIEAVKQWRYRPYLRNGEALPFQTIILVEFQR